MIKVRVDYNPYTVHTKISIEGQEVNSQSPLWYAVDKRLQKWIEPAGSLPGSEWDGFFRTLRDVTASSTAEIAFYGTAHDYEDFVYAKETFGDAVFSELRLNHANANDSNSPEHKLNQLKALYEELQNGPIPEFKSPEIRQGFEKAINSEFEIVVIAPVSSGKSTLLNAILEKKLLPAFNAPTTAVITRIRVNNNKPGFTVTATDVSGKTICRDEEATYEKILRLNGEIDPSDPAKKRSLLKEIVIEGPVYSMESDTLRTVFVDTPGGNNAQNELHGQMMRSAINDENKSIILYIFNGTQTGTNDSVEILREIADSMKKSANGKQSRDRYIFVANRMDDFDPEKENYEDYIRDNILPQLAEYDINSPNLLLVSANAAKLVRYSRNGIPLTRKEEQDLAKYESFFRYDDTDLRQYSMIDSRHKAAFKKRVEELKETEGGAREIVEIRSGVPALEAVIQEYLKKYALSMKIKEAQESFMRKVTERKMIDSCAANWAASEKALQEVREEIARKKKSFEKDNKYKEFVDAIEKIKMNEGWVIEKQNVVSIEYNKILQNLCNKGRNGKTKRVNAKTYLQAFENDINQAMERNGSEILEWLNETVLKVCQDMVDRYSDYVREMEKDGMLNLGGIDLRERVDFSPTAVSDISQMVNSTQYISLQSEVVGQKSVKTKGFFNVFKRLFNVGGYHTEDIREDVEYVDIAQIGNDQMSRVIEQFNVAVETMENEAKQKLHKLKAKTKEALEKIEHSIRTTLKEIEGKVASEEKLKEEVHRNKEKLEWTKRFIDKVDKLLEI